MPRVAPTNPRTMRVDSPLPCPEPNAPSSCSSALAWPLAPLVGTRLPQIKGIAFAGQLVDGEGGWRAETVLRNIVLAAPQGDIAGSVGLAWGARPRLRASEFI